MPQFFTRRIAFSVNDIACPEDGVLQKIHDFLFEHYNWIKHNTLDENVWAPSTPDAPSAKEKFGSKNISRWITQGVYLHEGLLCPEGQDAEKCLAERHLGFCPLLKGDQTTKRCAPFLMYDY